jgi:DNA-binding NarL/FixJ family response regulator
VDSNDVAAHHQRDMPGDHVADVDLALIAQRAVWEVKERTAALERSSRDLTDLLAAMAQPDDGDSELHVPAESLQSRHELLAWQCQEELMVFLAEDWRRIVMAPDANPAPFSAAIVRGARVRVIVARNGLTHDVEQAVQVMGHGVEWRSVEELPVSMMIADRSTALLSEGLTEGLSEGNKGGAVLLRHASAAIALSSLFDAFWQRAATLDAPGQPSPLETGGALQAHQRLAALLASGATDEAIARVMGISVRKLVRLIAAMREDLGAETRFQLGVRAAREGLV